MTNQIPRKFITELVGQVIRLQKRFAHEQVGVRNERRNEVKKIINRVASNLEASGGS